MYVEKKKISFVFFFCFFLRIWVDKRRGKCEKSDRLTKIKKQRLKKIKQRVTNENSKKQC